MQGGEIQNVLPDQMTLPSPILDTPHSSDSPTSTSLTSEEISTTTTLDAEDTHPLDEPKTCPVVNFAGIPPSGRLTKEASAQQAILAKKLRLSKIIGREAYYAAQASQRDSLRVCDEDDLRGDIRVLSPSLVNSQVLPKTRPLSPEPICPLKAELQNENLNSPNLRWQESGGGGRRKSEGIGRGGKEDEEIKAQEKESSKGKGRGRRRPRIFKLKFHHQALPPEYLDHYEASLRQEQRQSSYCEPVEGIRDTKSGPRETMKEGLQSGLRKDAKNRNNRNQRNSRPITIHEAGSGATEALLRDLLMANPHLQQAALQQAAIARAQSVPSIMLASVGSPQRLSYQQHMAFQPPSPDSSVGGDDRCSYASDMSIDEYPKRGRKPKKNDDSFLMGRGLGGMGLGNSVMDCQAEKVSSQMTMIDNLSETMMSPSPQHHYEKDSMARSKSYTSLIIPPQFSQNEPLNLCVRDESVNSSSGHSNYDNGGFESRVKIEPVQKEAANKRPDSKELEEGAQSRLYGSPHADYSAWNFGPGYTPQWVHDYRLKTEDGLSSGQSTPSLCSQSSHLPCMSPPTWPHLSPPPPSHIPSPHCISPAPPLSPMIPHPRHIQALIKESLQHKYEEASRERLSPRENLVTTSSMRSDRKSPITQGPHKESPAKSGARRKRSALFIPPADPSTEVSICKFKFTGGANPMLEEKKMVSVDAGGTLRYFSGGDRSFLRDPHNSPHTRLTGKLLDNLSKCEKDVKKIRLESDTDDTCSLPGGGYEASCSSTATSPTGTLENGAQSPLHLPSPIEDSPKRKRRSKKSSVREKLEQTLREKGLLIQTQQVESAEGATYCKFRQLRKITRYLFRSWKDYLPGQMHDGVPGEIPDSRTPPVYHPSNNLHPPPMSVHEYNASRR